MAIWDTATAALARRASSHSSILNGMNPAEYDSSNPITLFIIQAGIIIIFCRLLHYPLSLIGQPRVIAEVIGGILLGPSVMMRIPGFQESIFPTASMPVLNNVANLALIIFLFLVGLEVDLRLFIQNWKMAISVGVASMVLPFGLGVAIAWGLYHDFREGSNMDHIGFGTYALFIGTAMSITAFPVLCRILTELKLLRANVGVTALAAGVSNDVTGWILLALCIALTNNASGLTALWALLCTVGWALFLVYAVRPVFIICLRKSGSLQNGPTQSMVALTMLLVLTSAFFTGIIGVHPIFGAFLVGVICPHDGGFAVKMTEKIEDLISVLFLPLYFALSGLSTNLGLLNSGKAWAYIVGVLAVAFSGKVIGGTLSARFFKMEWRESLTIGVLMSCKGLVELIVLNVGLQAKILTEETFTIFVVMAVITTIATTPLTKLLFPPSYQLAIEKWRRGETDKKGRPLQQHSNLSQTSAAVVQTNSVRRLMVYLRVDSLSSLFTFVSLLESHTDHEPTPPALETEVSEAHLETPTEASSLQPSHLEVHGLRLLELTERTSSVMQSAEGAEYGVYDPVVTAFTTFSRINDIAAAGQVVTVPVSSYSETLVHYASSTASDFVIIPWSRYGSIAEDQTTAVAFDGLSRYQGRGYSEFIQQTLQTSPCPTAVFFDKNFGGNSGPVTHPGLSRTTSTMSSARMHREQVALPVKDKSHSIFFAFFGGADDRAALRFVLQLSKKTNVTTTIAHFSFSEDDTRMPLVETASTFTSETDAKCVEKMSAEDHVLLSSLQNTIPSFADGRVSFTEIPVTRASVLSMALQTARSTVGQKPRNAGDLVVVGRSHVFLGDGTTEMGNEMKNMVGTVATAVLERGVNASVLVVQDTRVMGQ